jgi:hypothetical protein
MFKHIFLIITSLAIFVACRKETKTTGPVITITSPVEARMFNNGDSVLVAFTITDPDMHGFDYSLINTTINDTFAGIDETHTHGNVYFSKNFAVPVSTNMKLVVNAEDHNGNTSTKSVNFHSM